MLGSHCKVTWAAWVLSAYREQVEMKAARRKKTTRGKRRDRIGIVWKGDMIVPPYKVLPCAMQPEGGTVFRLATLLPYPKNSGLRPVALRPRVSPGLPWSGNFYYLILAKHVPGKIFPGNVQVANIFVFFYDLLSFVFPKSTFLQGPTSKVNICISLLSPGGREGA